MVKRKKKSGARMKGLLKDKRMTYAMLAIGAVLVLGLGGSLFSTFGIESVWGADVEFDAIKFGSNLMDEVEDLPDYQFNVGSRTITINYDGVPQEEFIWEDADLYWNTPMIRYNDVGMKPKVNYDLGTFKYFDNMSVEVAEVVANIVYDGDTADIHFYFGFSIGFSTAAVPVSNGQETFRMYVPGAGMDYAYYSEALVESGIVEMTSAVALRFSPVVTDEYTYNGTVNSVTVLNQYGYYVTRPADYNGDLNITKMNADYGWDNREYYLPGNAEAVGVPEVLYNQIDSAGDEMAVITASARMNPAVDPVVQGVPFEYSEGEFDGWVNVIGMTVYNVGYIYDLIVDVSINDIPLVNPGADYLAGRIGISFSKGYDYPLWFNTDMMLAIAAILGFVAIVYVSKK